MYCIVHVHTHMWKRGVLTSFGWESRPRSTWLLTGGLGKFVPPLFHPNIYVPILQELYHTYVSPFWMTKKGRNLQPPSINFFSGFTQRAQTWFSHLLRLLRDIQLVQREWNLVAYEIIKHFLLVVTLLTCRRGKIIMTVGARNGSLTGGKLVICLGFTVCEPQCDFGYAMIRTNCF